MDELTKSYAIFKIVTACLMLGLWLTYRAFQRHKHDSSITSHVLLALCAALTALLLAIFATTTPVD